VLKIPYLGPIDRTSTNLHAMLNPKIVFPTFLLVLGAATAAQAENPTHLRQLLNTGRCRSCDLSYVNFSRQDLSNADLAGANLRGSNFSNANLSNADLSNADLQDANLNNADLQGAIVQGTLLDRRTTTQPRRDANWGRQGGEQIVQTEEGWGRRRQRGRHRGNSDWNSRRETAPAIDQTTQRYASEIRSIYAQVTNQQLNNRDLQQYVQALGRGESIATIRYAMARSPEARAALNGLYRKVFDRNIDPSGLKTWTEYMGRGRSLSDVYRELSESQEARSRQY
jgi:uncharacterized protein YjbI with pentapeptide repeats